MFPPKVVLKEFWVGDGDIIGRNNLEDSFSYASEFEENNNKSIVQLTNS